jgi:Ca2+-binding EF-hand superfamily protein
MRYLVIVSAALFSSVALAQGQSGSSVFDQFDADRDGNISQSEARANATLAQNFSAADTDGDGKLSKEEFNAAFTRSSEPSEGAAR